MPYVYSPVSSDPSSRATSPSPAHDRSSTAPTRTRGQSGGEDVPLDTLTHEASQASSYGAEIRGIDADSLGVFDLTTRRVTWMTRAQVVARYGPGLVAGLETRARHQGAPNPGGQTIPSDSAPVSNTDEENLADLSGSDDGSEGESDFGRRGHAYMTFTPPDSAQSQSYPVSRSPSLELPESDEQQREPLPPTRSRSVAPLDQRGARPLRGR